jgi:hypothetical protein
MKSGVPWMGNCIEPLQRSGEDRPDPLETLASLFLRYLVDPLCLAARSMHVLPNLSFAPWCRLGKPNPYSFLGESRAEPAPRIPHPFPKSSARTSRAKERLRNVHAWNTVYCCWSGRLHIPWTRCQISFHTPLLYYLLAKNKS